MKQSPDQPTKSFGAGGTGSTQVTIARDKNNVINALRKKYLETEDSV